MSESDRQHHDRYCYLCEDMQIRLSVAEDADARAERLRTAMEEADQAINGDDRDYVIVNTAEIIRNALSATATPAAAEAPDARDAEIGSILEGIRSAYREAHSRVNNYEFWEDEHWAIIDAAFRVAAQRIAALSSAPAPREGAADA